MLGITAFRSYTESFETTPLSIVFFKFPPKKGPFHSDLLLLINNYILTFLVFLPLVGTPQGVTGVVPPFVCPP
jgi:hypothetical protein